MKYSIRLYNYRTIDNGPVSTATDMSMVRLTGRLNIVSDITSAGHLTMVQLVLRLTGIAKVWDKEEDDQMLKILLSYL